MGIEELVEKRKKEAEDKNIFEKAHQIAQTLGLSHFKGYGVAYEYEYQDKKFNIWSKSEVPYKWIMGIIAGRDSRRVRVRFQGETVFSYEYGGYSDGRGISIFLPGDWEKSFCKLYSKSLQAQKKALKEEEQKRMQKEKDKEKELRKRFGL